MSQYHGVDHATFAKRGFLLGVALFAVGVGGEVGGRALLGTLPALVNTLLVDMEAIGILLALFSPLVFGIVLPLVE